MKTLRKLSGKVLGSPGFAAMGFFLMLACSTVKEQGEPNVATEPTVISNDAQRRAIYENGSGVTLPQNANPIPNSNMLRLNEKASDINRKKNIEEGGNTNAPANTPTEERPRQMPNTGIDTVFR